MNVEQLDWQDFSEDQLAVYRPDYIIAADVVRTRTDTSRVLTRLSRARSSSCTIRGSSMPA
jgi:hypothetical protein